MTNNHNSKKNISVIGLIQVIAFITLIMSISTVFDEYYRFLELFSHFKFQYLISSLVCLLIFIALKHYKSAITMVMVSLLNMTYVLPWYFSPTGEVTGETVEITLMHSNVNTRNQNFQGFIDLVHSESPDILIAQEINQKWLRNIQQIEKSYPYKYAAPREDNFGIAMFSKYPFDNIKEYYWGVSNLPSLQAEFTISEQKFTTITTHPLPPVSDKYYKSRNSQIVEVSEVSKNIDNPLIVIGDLNVTMWSSDYIPLEKSTNLTNTRKGFGILPTWPAMMPIFMIPIDQCLVSSHFVVRDIKVGEDIGSDHLPLIVKLGLND